MEPDMTTALRTDTQDATALVGTNAVAGDAPTYAWQSPAGRFTIRPDGGGWRLWLDEHPLGWATRAETAAQDVAMRSSGAGAWDATDFAQASAICPADLSRWDQVG